MKTSILVAILSTFTFTYAQEDRKISTIDFVQIVDGNKKEALFYYENNWKVLRDKALENNYIHSFEFLETPLGENALFQLMLVTTYANREQYDLGEDRFDVLIAEKGPLRLMNEKKPNEFRKVVFNKLATHLH